MLRNLFTIILALAVVSTVSLNAQGKMKKSEPQKQETKAMDSQMSKDTPGGVKKDIVVMKTSMGTVKIELYADKAPTTVKNFLSYVDEKFYDNTVFHRVMKTFMIQGGGFEASDPIKQKAVKAPIKIESDNGLSNVRGSIAMARTGDPNSATCQFFINVVDNRMLDRGQSDPNGYTVFGKVIEGMDVVDKIKDVKTGNLKAIAMYNNQEMPQQFSDVPLSKVVIESIRRAEGSK